MAETLKEPVHPDVIKRRKAWFRHFLVWRYFGRLLTIIIAGGSAYVASGLSENHLREGIALVVAACAALQAALAPDKKSREYREAWIQIDQAIHAVEEMPTELRIAILRGENIIGETQVEAPKKPKPETGNPTPSQEGKSN